MNLLEYNASWATLEGDKSEIECALSTWTVPRKTDDAPESVAVRTGNDSIMVPVGLLFAENPTGIRIRRERKTRSDFYLDPNESFSRDWRPRPYEFQREAIAAGLYHGRGQIVAPPRSGKTFIGARIVEVLLRTRGSSGLKILWLAPTQETREQAATAFKSASAVAEANGRAGGWIQLSCYAALSAENDAAFLSQIDILIVDEAHHVPASGLYATVQACTRAAYRFALSATPTGRSDGRDLLLEAGIGPVIYRIGRNALLDQGRVVDARVKVLLAPESAERNGPTIADTVASCLRGEFPQTIEKRKWQISKEIARGIAEIMEEYGQETDFAEAIKPVLKAAGEIISQEKSRMEYRFASRDGVTAHTGRNAMAAIEAVSSIERGDSVLVLVSTKEQGRAIVKLVGQDKSAFVHSTMKAAEGRREDVIEQFKTGGLKCLIATSLADEGIDLPSANVLILVNGGRSALKTEQRSARVLTADGKKDFGLIVDFLDVQHPMLKAHSLERIETYKHLGYSIEMDPAASAFLDRRRAGPASISCQHSRPSRSTVASHRRRTGVSGIMGFRRRRGPRSDSRRLPGCRRSRRRRRTRCWVWKKTPGTMWRTWWPCSVRSGGCCAATGRCGSIWGTPLREAEAAANKGRPGNEPIRYTRKRLC
jgi:superfamily II DNA or RNA helicase